MYWAIDITIDVKNYHPNHRIVCLGRGIAILAHHVSRICLILDCLELFHLPIMNMHCRHRQKVIIAERVAVLKDMACEALHKPLIKSTG